MHNSSGFDATLLLASAAHYGLTPDVITRGNKLLSMEIASLGLRFLDSMLFCPGSLAKVGQRYGLEETKGSFPHHMNRAANYDYEGETPSVENFCGENTSPSDREKIAKFVNESRQSGHVWNFKKEIYLYCRNDVIMLARSMLEFVREWAGIQRLLQDYFRPDDPLFLHPFNRPFITFGAFIFAIYREFEGKNHDVRVINDERGLTSIKTSRGELEWSLWQFEQLGRPADFQSRFLSPRPPRLGRVTPDFYLPSTNTAGFFQVRQSVLTPVSLTRFLPLLSLPRAVSCTVIWRTAVPSPGPVPASTSQTFEVRRTASFRHAFDDSVQSCGPSTVSTKFSRCTSASGTGSKRARISTA